MESNQERQGLFAVRISMKNGIPVAILTGDHFDCGSTNVAYAISKVESKEAMLRKESPMYLVRDTVVRLAMDTRRRALIGGFSECHAGNKGKPCGNCKKCIAAKDAAFTRVILGSMEIPDNIDNLKTSLSSVIGLTWMDAKWDNAMTNEEVEKVFDEIGIAQNKQGKDDETH